MVRKSAPWLVALGVAALGLALLMIPKGTTAQPAAPRTALWGTVLPSLPAPRFRLRDADGGAVSLAALRGKPVILTFMQSQCTQLCPVVAESLHRALQDLGPLSSRVTVLAISTDPEHDTPASVRKFSRRHGMLGRWHYLLGSRRMMTPVWSAYHLYVAPAEAPAQVRGAHTSATYLIDARGRERVLMGGDPDAAWVVNDVRLLLGLRGTAPVVASLPAPDVGHVAPSFTLSNLAGASIRLTSLHGKVVLLNFWSTTCTVCLSEMPRLQRWYAQLRSRGVVVLGVDDLETRGDAATFVRKTKVRYPIVVDESGDVSARYDVAFLPKSLLLDRRGTVVAVRLGALDNSFLVSHLTPLVKERIDG